MIKIKGAIFDVDGTILDSMGVWLKVTGDFFRDNTIAISYDELLSYQSMSFEESLVGIQRDYLPHMDTQAMFEDFKRRAAHEYIYNIPPKDGVCEYIKKLHKDGIKLAVATSGFPELVKKSLTRIGVYDCFCAFSYSAEVGCSKSNPDIYLLSAKRLGLEPKDCTVYEDILTGIESAKAAGFCTVAIKDATNAADTDRLIQHSDRYITGWAELLSNK